MFIESLTLASRDVQAQVHFYKTVLGFECIDCTDETATLKIGDSLLKFVYNPKATQHHFAFNIPSDAHERASEWLTSRVGLIKNEDGHMFYFNFWDAYAIYFYDADQNIVEFIARAEVPIMKQDDFCPSQVLGISEMGIPSISIDAFHQQLCSLNVEIPIYYGSYERFCALGDYNGMFILVNPLKKDYWFPTDDLIEDVDFNIQIRLAENSYHLKYKNRELTLLC